MNIGTLTHASSIPSPHAPTPSFSYNTRKLCLSDLPADLFTTGYIGKYTNAQSSGNLALASREFYAKTHDALDKEPIWTLRNRHDLNAFLAMLDHRPNIQNIKLEGRNFTDQDVQAIAQKATKLQHVEISYCPQVSTLPSFEHNKALQHVEIRYCHGLQTLPSFEHNKALQHVEISSCPQVSTLPSFEHNKELQHVVIRYCRGLQTLPSFEHNKALQHVEISSCHGLQTLPNDLFEHNTNLQHVVIRSCQGIPSAQLENLRRIFPQAQIWN